MPSMAPDASLQPTNLLFPPAQDPDSLATSIPLTCPLTSPFGCHFASARGLDSKLACPMRNKYVMKSAFKWSIKFFGNLSMELDLFVRLFYEISSF